MLLLDGPVATDPEFRELQRQLREQREQREEEEWEEEKEEMSLYILLTSTLHTRAFREPWNLFNLNTLATGNDLSCC